MSRTSFQKIRAKAWTGALLTVAVVILVTMTGCGGPAVVVDRPEPIPAPAPPKAGLPLLGYSIQVGAFSRLENALRLADSLEYQGLEAYYFRHQSGLFKVRFGDFITREEAVAKADSLVSIGMIDAYYIVNPGDSPAVKVRIYGVARLRNEIVSTAEGFIGIPYQWGGSSPDSGFDCSGLARAVYQLNGLNLPRRSMDQFRMGSPVDAGDLAKGDLVFFATSGGGKVSHVGVYAGKGKFIHAPGKGKRIRGSSLANTYFRKRFIGARTYL